MHRIDGPGATVDQKFTEGDPATATPATTVTDDWLNSVQEEIAAVIESSGIALSKASNGQLLAAITSKISAAIPANVPQGVSGAFSGLRLSATGLSAAVSVAADEVTLSSAAQTYRTLKGVSLSINSAASGANGLDTGSIAVSTWYSVWVIWNGTTTAGLISLSATAPVMPAGYTHKARVGWIRTDSTVNKYPLGFTQSGRSVQMLVAPSGNVPNMPLMASGAAGAPDTPTWVSVGVGSFVPSTASKVKVVLMSSSSSSVVTVAPNSNFGGANSNTNTPPLKAVFNSGGSSEIVNAEIMLEGANIYWASGAAGGRLFCFGWEDNL